MALHESYQKWLEIGSQMGLTESSLMDFVKSSIADEKALRLQEREDKKIQQENMLKEKQIQADLEREKLAAELADKKLAAELAEKRRIDELADKQRTEERNYQLKVVQLQNERDLAEQRIRSENERLQVESETRRKMAESDSRTSTVDEDERLRCQIKNYNLGLSKFDNNSANLQSFLSRFEMLASTYEIPKKLWAIELSRSLEGISLQVFESLSPDGRMDYEILKHALLKKFEISEGSFRRLFFECKTANHESQTDFAHRLTTYLRNWLKLAGGKAESYEDLETLLVKNNYFRSQPKCIQVFIKEHGSHLSLQEMVKLSEAYREAHDIKAENENFSKFSKDKVIKPFVKPTEVKGTQNTNQSSNKQTKESDAEKKMNKRACYGCGSEQHMLRNCPNAKDKTRTFNKSDQRNQSAACSIIESSKPSELTVVLPNGETVPIVAAVSERKVTDKFLPDLVKAHKGQGLVNNRPVKFVRDTASSITIVRSNLIRPEQMTDQTVTCMLADGCVKTFKLAEVDITTPYYTGPIKAASIDTAIHELLIGNDYIKQIANKEPDIDSQSYSSKKYRGPFMFENSQLSQSHSRDDEMAVCEMSAEENTHGIKSCDDKRSSEITKNYRELDNSEENLDYQQRAESKNRNSDSSERLITEIGRINNEGYPTNSLHIGRNRSERQLYHPIVPIYAVRCGNEVSTSSPVSCNWQPEINNQSEISQMVGRIESDHSRSCESVDHEVNAAVQTRSQIDKESRTLKPLKLTKFEALNLTVDEFRRMQKTDPNLEKYWKLGEEVVPNSEDSKIKFAIKNDILYRHYKNGSSEVVKQVMVPEPLIDKVISYAHESILSGHCSLAKTLSKLMQEFYFYSMNARVRRFVMSCDLCQRGSNRKVGGKAPLMSMPIVKDPFDTVYIDIVGEVQPCSSEGHRWILTMMCASTRFPIAVPMKKIDSVSIAEELMTQFNTFGHPRLIISDNGANISSDVLMEANRLYGTRMHKIPVYRPESNSVLERSHQVMKSILRKLIVEQPKMWHRFISPLLFAIRSTNNVSGFSPFQLLFGRACRSHLTLLKDLWTKNDGEPESKTVYQYVLDLRERIESTCELAQKEFSKIQGRNQRYNNVRAKLRILQPGDSVLVLVPNPKCKLDFIWKGPAKVLERRGVVNYKIKFDDDQVRTYHINMLKKYINRNDISKQVDTPAVTDSVQQISHQKQNETDENDDENLAESAAVMGIVEESDDEMSDKDLDEVYDNHTTGKMDLYNLSQKETWKDVDINPSLTREQQDRLWKLVERYKDIFSDVPTITSLTKHKIELTSDVPVKSKPYKIPIHLQDAVEKEIDSLLENGWIEKSTAEYASPIVVVKKKQTNDIRLCINYKKLNDISKDYPQPMPEIDDVLAQIGPAKIYTTIDMCKGYYAVAMEESSKDYTSFVTPKDMYRFRVMPFGLKNSGATYSALLRQVLNGARNMQSFVDDVIAYNSNFETHEKTLQDLFQRVKEANLKIKPSKTKIGFSKVEYLGHVISQGTITPTNEHVEKIVNAPVPKSKHGVRSLCGTVGFLRKFIPKCASYLKPLHELTGNKSSNVIRWTDRHQEALDRIKKSLTSHPILNIYDSSKRHVLQTDSSDSCVGGVLLQEADDGLLHPVMYASRKLLDRESRYHIVEKEMLAIVWCCGKFYKYLYASHFTIQTDCQALCVLNGKMSSNARVIRWQLYMQSFNYTVEVIKGSDNCIADYLSRMHT